MEIKNLWIINEYAGSPYHGIEYRSYYLAKELIKLGYNITIISSNYSHLFKKHSKPGHENIDGINYFWIKTLNYKKSNSFLRILKWFLFTYKLFFVNSKLPKPDLIILSPMQTMPILPALYFKKKYKVKLFFEVKDIWPKSIIQLGNYSKNNILIKILEICEKLAIKKSDKIISSLCKYDEHIKEIGENKTFEWVCNGFDEDLIHKTEPLPKKIEAKIPKKSFIIGYTGTVGIANALDFFIDSIKYLDDIDVKFVIVGDGNHKEFLENKYKNNKNIIFVDRIKKEQVLSIIKFFDICYIGWHKSDLYRYGISPNKLFDYMYAEKPILHSFSGEGDFVKFAKCGITVPAEDPLAISEAIREFILMNESQRILLGGNGKKYLLENFTYKQLSVKLDNILKN